MKKLPKYKTQDNANLFPQEYEYNDGISMTVQNDTFSLRDIVEKFTREYPKHLERSGYYDDWNEDNFDDIDNTRNPDFDLIDAYEMKNTIKQKEQNMITFSKKSKQQKNESQKVVNEELSSSKPSDV